MADLVESDGYRPALRGLRSRVDYLIRLVRIVCPLMSLIEIYVRAYGNVRFLLFSRALGGRVLSHEDLGILDMILEAWGGSGEGHWEAWVAFACQCRNCDVMHDV